MPELMLKPGWPGKFQRTLPGPKKTLIVFEHGKPVEVTTKQLKELAGDVGVSIYQVERDEKNRPRFVETEPADIPPAVPKQNMDMEPGPDVAHV